MDEELMQKRVKEFSKIAGIIDEMPVYGVWIHDKRGGGWLRFGNGMIFQTPSRACAEAQLEIIAADGEVRQFGS